MSTVRKAVIPAAGLGTRFLPASKSIPKEMLPIVDRPTIEYVVEEAVRAGIRDILVVNGRGKGPIEDHFDRQHEPLGLGHAVSVARQHVGNESFAVLLGDDVMVDDAALLRSMIEIHDQEQASVVALLEVEPDEISAYGCAVVDP